MQYMESLKKIDIEEHDAFPCNNANNECWLCEREIAMSCFSGAVSNLVEVDSSNMKKEKQRHTEHYWSFENDDHILRWSNSAISQIVFSFKRKETKCI